MVSPKIGPSFFGKNYEKYVSELTTEGTIAGENLTPEERKEGFKKKSDKIDFKNFLEKVLERLPPDAQKKITEGEIKRLNFDGYEKKISVDDVKENSSVNTKSKDRDIGSESSASGLVTPKAQLINSEQLFKFDEVVLDPDRVATAAVKSTDSDKLSSAIVKAIEPEVLTSEITKVIDEETEEKIPDDLDDLLKDIREEKEKKEDDVKISKDDKILTNIKETNKNLLETNEILYGLILSLKKEMVEDKKRAFKEKDKLRKEKRKESFAAARTGRGLSGPNLERPRISAGGLFDNPLMKFLGLSALAGLVKFIPALVEFIETLPERINKFITEDIPNFVGEKFTELRDFLGEKFSEIGTTISKKFNEFRTFVGGFFSDRFEEIKGFFEDVYNGIDEFTGGRLTEFIEGIKGLGPMIVEKSKEFYKTVDDWTGGRISGAFNWIGKNVIDPLGNFFKEKIDYVGTKAGELWTNFSSSFLNFFGDIDFGLPDLGVTELTSNVLGLEPALEGPDLSGDVITMGDSIAVGVRGAQGVSADTSMAKEGAGTKEILGNIQKQGAAGNLQGKTLQLSSGISNTKGDTDTVREQLRAAKEGGATGVQLMGTANEGDYDQNAALQAIAQEDEFRDFVKFQGGFKAGGDEVHPESYSKVAQALATNRQDNIQEREQARMQAAGPGFAAPLFDLIASKEGSYNSVNRGEAGDSPGGAAKYFGKNLTDMSVDEVMNLQGQEKLYAAGKYQIVPTTMEDFVARGGVSRNDMFNEATQEKFPKYVVHTKRPEVGNYLNGKGSLEDALIGLSAEFASIGVPRDMQPGEYGSGYPKTFRPKGTTFYGGTSNAAHTTPESVASALKQVKGGGSQSPQSSPQPQRSAQPVTSALLNTLDEVDAGKHRKLPPNVRPTSAAIPKNESGYSGKIKYFSSNGGGNKELVAGQTYKYGDLRAHHDSTMRANGIPKDYTLLHGRDINNSPNADIPTPFDGKVTGYGVLPGASGYGKAVELETASGGMLFAHLSKLGSFKEGDVIKAGTIIGTQGSTGGNYEDHLHLDASQKGHEAFVNYITGGKPMYRVGVTPKSDIRPGVTPAPAAANVAPSQRRDKVADALSKTPSRASRSRVNAINLPPEVRNNPILAGSSGGQSSSTGNYVPRVSTRTSSDIYQINTRSLFNIVG